MIVGILVVGVEFQRKNLNTTSCGNYQINKRTLLKSLFLATVNCVFLKE